MLNFLLFCWVIVDRHCSAAHPHHSSGSTHWSCDLPTHAFTGPGSRSGCRHGNERPQGLEPTPSSPPPAGVSGEDASDRRTIRSSDIAVFVSTFAWTSSCCSSSDRHAMISMTTTKGGIFSFLKLIPSVVRQSGGHVFWLQMLATTDYDHNSVYIYIPIYLQIDTCRCMFRDLCLCIYIYICWCVYIYTFLDSRAARCEEELRKREDLR